MVAGLVALVAPEARIMPIRVLDDEGLGTLFGVCKGIVTASAHGADVINASFGMPQFVETLSHKLRVANVHGVITVAGAGNRDLEFPPYHPACDPLAFMVTALDSADVKADFADYSTHVIVSAPGVGIRSAYPGGWAIGSGCSFATPLVAGETALLMSSERSLSFENMGDLLAAGVDPIYYHPGNEPYYGKLGAGRINLPLALGVGVTCAAPETNPEVLSQVHVRPNPAWGDVHLELTGEQAGPWQLSIFDTAGRLVHASCSVGSAQPGWSARDLTGLLVPPGIYFVRLTTRERTATTAFTILR
jgi:subtilisin family serine protease